MIKDYLKQVLKTTSQGDAREESYYVHLAQLLQNFAVSKEKTNIQITILPTITSAGNPDFRIWDGDQNIVGYIEAKRPGENLDVIERSEQLQRYRNTFPNLILTDFYEFRLYRKGEMIDQIFIARSTLARKGIPPPVENEEKFFSLLEKFFAFTLPKVTTAEQLAKELAIRTRFLRDEVISAEMEQQQKGKGELYGFYETFKKFLIANLSEKDFADLFSQTITYGLFAARTRSANGFNRKLAYDLIPKTIGILRNVFRFVSQGDLPKHMEVMVDDIAEVLNAADARNILHQYFKAGKGEDPIVHFYETFLSEYDPTTREKRGVYYTPEPVVRFIVRGVHQVLKTHFNLEDGLASKEVTVLDPAGGTLTFPAEAIKLAVNEHTVKYGDGGVHKLISEHILPNFYSFELMMAPYAIGHIKISFLLEEFGYTMQDNERFKLYLTNTLDMEDLSQTLIPGLESLSDESHEAGKVKKNEPILVIMGNPPYSANSSNYSNWTEKLLKENIDGAQSYYKVDGNPLNEHNPKLLQDDYVKFLRFAQWKIHKAGQGIVGMITNHGFLSNVTFRGMRQSLLSTFNEIYITDLHGDSQKKEKAPDGSKDENVFDITKGTAISIFVKKPGAKDCTIYHNDVFGLRQSKYDWLDSKDFNAGNYEQLSPVTPWYFFIPRNTSEIEHYNQWPRLTEIFPVNSTGIKTHRDNFVIDFDSPELARRIKLFSQRNTPDEIIRETFNLKDNRDWKLAIARKKIFEKENPADVIKPIAYRPFDKRYVMYSEHLIDWPRREVMQHMGYQNIAIIATRLNRQISKGYFFVSDTLSDVHLLDNAQDSIIVAPLYLYTPQAQKRKTIIQSMMLFEPEPEYHKTGKKPNIAPRLFEALEKSFNHQPTPEQILHYCYGVMYSNIYREKFAEFLKIDFPRIPFTGNFDLFIEMAGFGEKLTQLHLLKSKTLDNPVVKFWGQGNDKIEKPVFQLESGRIYINSTKYFQGITAEMWNYHIGGYKILEKYLKDRKGRQMTDSKTYCKIATAIAETIKFQTLIDTLFEEISNNLIEVELSG